MHDCPACGQACYCDMDDCFFEYEPNCRHRCVEEEDFDDAWAEDDGDRAAAASPVGAPDPADPEEILP